MNHIGGGKGLLGGYRNYKYNGKELQETGMYDYGARFYMPDIGRWAVVDQEANILTKLIVMFGIIQFFLTIRPEWREKLENVRRIVQMVYLR
ncbi:RHS repeat-associated core domain-containing protein [Chryseobacterium flavum]|uniref:RHS repeat-associated core domain-containing protein n=1 Tax=Chryseobacterium flavum TaxID=415851 RepID=UPI002FDAC12A